MVGSYRFLAGMLKAESFRVNLLPDLESLQKKMHEISVILNSA